MSFFFLIIAEIVAANSGKLVPIAIIGSNYAVVNAEHIAVMLNVPQVIIGLTIIAIGTSLPELAATIVRPIIT